MVKQFDLKSSEASFVYANELTVRLKYLLMPMHNILWTLPF